MEFITDLERKVEQMKSESENSAEELIQLRVQHQSVKTRNQILTEQVTRYVQRSRDLEHELCNTQQEIVQLRQQLSIDDDTTASGFVTSADFDTGVMTAPLQLTSTFLTNLGSTLPNSRNAFLDLNGSGNAPMYSAIDCPASSLGLGILPPEVSSIGLSSYGYLSDSSWLGFPYSSFPIDAQLEGRFGGQPMMLNPSLSPPATTMTVSPRLHSSVFCTIGHETITEGPSDYPRSLENVLEAPEEAQALDDATSLSLSELFADEIEQIAERRVKRFRKP